MAMHRILGWPLFALFLVALFSAPLSAQSPSPLHPIKRHPGANDFNPFMTARIQVARLRQSADQMRLLANQPLPAQLADDMRTEYVQHRLWLQQAGHRISVLADQWEDRIKPLSGARAIGKAVDLNAFFEAQSVSLQSKLRRESLTHSQASERLRSSGDTARLVIGKMY